MNAIEAVAQKKPLRRRKNRVPRDAARVGSPLPHGRGVPGGSGNSLQHLGAVESPEHSPREEPDPVTVVAFIFGRIDFERYFYKWTSLAEAADS